MRAELQHLFHVNLDDVWDGTVTVRHAVYLLGESPNYGDSLIRGEELGVPWTPEVQAIAILHDLVAAFMAGDKFTDEHRFPRPKTASKGGEEVLKNEDGQELFAPTIAEFIQRSGEFMSRVMNPD